MFRYEANVTAVAGMKLEKTIPCLPCTLIYMDNYIE